MRLVVTEFVSLDGVMEDPGGAEGFKHGGWSFAFPSEEAGKYKLDELMASDAQLLGRKTYEGFAKVWPTVKDDIGFAEQFNAMPKYVVSSTLQTADWNNSTILKGDLVDEVRKLKAMPGRDLLVAGSAQLVQGLLENGLVDELRLMVHPVVLGSGKRIFGDAPDKMDLKLVEARPLGDAGQVMLIYSQTA